MADFVFLEGFDYYFSGTATPNGSQAQWVKGFLDQSLVPGRYGGKCLQHTRAGGTENILCNLPEGNITTGTITIGFAFKSSNLLTRQIIILNPSGSTTEQFSIWQHNDGSISFRNGGTTLATSAAGLLSANVWCYIEAAVTISNSGSFDVQLNGGSVVSGSGDTMGGTNADTGRITLPEPASSGTMWYDDLYVRDDLTFAGPSQIIWRRPLAALAGDFNLSATSAYIYPLLVDDYSTDTTAYITGDSAGDEQLFSFEGFDKFTGSGVKAVSLIVFAKTDAGTANADPKIVSNGNTLTPAGWSFDTTFRFQRRIVTNDPDTAAPWTRAALAAMNAGLEITSLSGGATALQVSMVGVQALVPEGAVYAVAGGHRHWRIVPTSSAAGTGRVGTFDLSLLAADGERLMLVGFGGAGGEYSGSLARPNSVDGRNDTSWVSGSHYTATDLSLDFGGPIIPKYAVLGSQRGSTSESFRTFTIDYSDDGSTWTTLYTHSTPELSWGTTEARTFTLPDLTPPSTGRRRQALVLN